MKAEDYAAFARGKTVLVQLKGNMCMAVDGTEGIELAESMPAEGQWLAHLVDQYKRQRGTSEAPSPQELEQLLLQNPPPTSPVMIPVFLCTLAVQGELLIATYESSAELPGGKTSQAKVEVTLDPNDIKHVSAIKSTLFGP